MNTNSGKTIGTEPWPRDTYFSDAHTWKGKPVEDKWKYKRLLFKKNLSFKKVGTIGKFWMKPKKVLWQQVKDVEKRIGEGLEQPGIEELVVHVADLTGEPVKDVQRTLGYYSNESTIKEWVEKIVSS